MWDCAHYARMQLVVRLAIIGLFAGTFGFLMMIGYAIRTLFADFGYVLGFLGSLSTVIGCLSFAFLVDRPRPPGRM